jgi:hypothetical protein
MNFDICIACDGSGFRNEFEGSMCYACNGLGVIQDADPDDEEYDDDYVSPDDQKRNDAIERGDELRDRAKDERAER